MPRSSETTSPSGLGAVVRAAERDLRHRVAQHAGSDRVALGMVGIQEALRRRPLDHLGQLPSQVHRILHADVEALSTHRRMHVRGVAGQQDASLAVGRGLPRHVGEPGDPGGTVDPVIGPVDGDERLAEIAQGGFARGSDVLFGHHDPHRATIRVDHLAVADLVLHLPMAWVPRASWRMPNSGSSAISTSAISQLVVGSHPGNSMPAALRTRLRPPSQPTRYCRPQRLAVGQLDVDAGVVLREARHLTSAIDRHLQLADPVGQDALDVVLPQPESVGVPGGEVADVQAGSPANPATCSHLSLRQEPVGDAALVEDLDGARVQAAGARAGEVLAGAPLDDGDVDARQRQLARQHQPCRTSSGDHHRMLGHRVRADRHQAGRGHRI